MQSRKPRKTNALGEPLIQHANRLESVDYHQRMDRLRQDVEIMPTLMGVFQHVSSPGVPGHEQHFAFWKNFADFNGRINPCHFLHHDIADEHIERDRSRSVNCLRAAVSGRGIEPKQIQNFNERIGNKSFIINDKDIQFAGLNRSCGHILQGPTYPVV